jgi:hypothetical protein
MKKWIIAAGGILILLVAGFVYLWIPSNVRYSYHVKMTCNARGALRVVADSSRWVNWAPEEGRNISYHLQGQNNYVLNVRIQGRRDSLLSRLLLVPTASPDSTDCYWQFDMPTGRMPVGRIRRYLFARDVVGDMGTVLGFMRAFLAKKENVYGLNIQPAATKDSFLIAVRGIFPGGPTLGDIYGLIGGLRGYMGREGAHETGYPMLNITKLADGRRQMEIAIPVDRQLKEGSVFYSRKLVPGHYLMAEVKGGEHAIDRAMTQMQNYVNDYQKTVMAIPFQSLVTDRMKEPDENKWITRIYYPVY